jgi:hypothetical protein
VISATSNDAYTIFNVKVNIPCYQSRAEHARSAWLLIRTLWGEMKRLRHKSTTHNLADYRLVAQISERRKP